MKLSDFDYDLPKELIAQTPLKQRDKSRLMIVDKDNGQIKDSIFSDITSEIGEGDVLVLNQTKVINARLKGFIVVKNLKGQNKKEVEIFLHKQISDNTWDCLVYPGKKLKPGKEIKFYLEKEKLNSGFNKGKLSKSQSMIGGVFEGIKSENGIFPILTAKIKKISNSGRIVEFNKGGIDFLKIIEKMGEIPLPPYIKEKLENSDRYQTVYNKTAGSVAAPTAGLHFTDNLLKKLEKKGVKIEKVLLHVGLGTFINVQTKDIENHKMHSEYIELKKEVADRLNRYKKEGKKIISVGTTSTRVLESFSDENGVLKYGKFDTNIFIYPGYKWKFVDSLITNFHLPKSTLLMLVSSFAGKDSIKKAYKHAIKHKYRFFSFGDAMLLK